MRVRVKICGVTTVEAIEAAVAAGADAIGFVLTPSPRRLDLERARALAAHVPPFVARVAVLHEPSPSLLEAVCTELAPDVVQCEPSLIMDRLGRPFLPVFHDHRRLAAEVARYRADRRRLVHIEGDGRGGRGLRADHARAAEIAAAGPIVLAGGLDPVNVAEAVRRVAPWAVDVSSGCESAPGVKDPDRIESFIAAVRASEAADRTHTDRTHTPREIPS